MDRGTEMMAAARELARIGPVMPVRGKVPLWNDWPARATRAPNNEPEWAEATGIGLLTGARAGYFVLDVDGERGRASLEALESTNGGLPPTWRSRTGSGGLHIFFRWPDFAVKGSASKLGPGLDIRGEGGQVVAPPSLHPSGAFYEWLTPPAGMPADAPPWLLEMLKPPAPRLVHSAPTESDVLRRASLYLAKIPGAISGSRGHDTAWKAALSVVRGFGLTEADGFALLWAEYNPRCEPPWSEKELRHKIDGVIHDSALTWGYLRDAPYSTEAPAPGRAPGREEPGCDDGDDTPAIELPFKLEDVGVGDFFATAEDKIQWVMEPFIPKGAFVLVQGGPKSGKTWFGAWLAGECAKMGLRVAVVEEEGPKEVLRDRLKPFLPDPIAVNRNLRVLYKKRIRIDNSKILQALIELYRGFDVIVLDPFIRLHGRKEKESDEMMAVLACVQKLMLETGAAIILIHHTKKNESWHRTRTSDAGLDDGRGSGTIASEADNVIAIRGVPPAERRAGQVRFIVENPGSRVGAEFDKRTAVIDLAEQAQAPFTWAGSSEVSAGDTEEDEICEIVELIIDHKNLPKLEKKAVSGTAIAKILRRNKKACLEAVKRLTRHGVLECIEGRYGPLYFKPETTNDAP